jgi:catechol 2,3-dioxygenase-like lactoylglutathione lyase family enzyme
VTSQNISLQPPVPVMRVASATDARKFYVDFLGFTVDWGWSEDPRRPLYAQVSRSGVSLHLTDQIANGATQLLIRMTGLDALQEELSRKAHPYALRFCETPDDRRELQVTDPFGNLLRFSENNPPGGRDRPDEKRGAEN